MRTQQFTDPTVGTVQYPNAIAFMYSRQPVIVTCGNGANYEVTVTVTCTTNGGQSYTETRLMYNGRVEFDISRIMQVLAGDVDGVLQRLDYGEGRSLGEVFSLSVRVISIEVLNISDIQAMYGALDAGEVYGAPITYRFFYNYPQSFTMWYDVADSFGVRFDGEDCEVPVDAIGGPALSREVGISSWLSTNIAAKLRNGRTIKGWTTWLYKIQDGSQVSQEARETVIVPDLSPKGSGVYLRWLNRRGGVSYWLFTRSKIRVMSSRVDEFTRYYRGDLTVPLNDAYRNPQKVSYRELREMTIGAVQLNNEEFEYLSDLATSPVVERLLDTNSTRWERVKVATTTFERDVKRATPSLQNLEVTIELLERNTIRI